ncbi:hypothetical protein [Microbacterium sp. lyk4-40-TSB-66]|uniref:hypothetical protein n=1 Tax=Microbacterium sp. lyk4-40-TSB-66 TaxID=3040294 RepID=UPI00254AF05F|nr:hypothetical protein [Microbacterium sp. lyk4-40-TSB-66]
MSIDEEAELAQLRRRAYSPAADIASDPHALRRLVELEARVDAEETSPAPVEHEPVVPGDEPAPDAAPDPPRFSLPRPRRSTVILLGAAALVIATLATALTLVQRVQTDPLQTGATQIARLSPDPDFDVPSSLARGVTGEVTAYAEFEGFRALTLPSYRDSESTARCMTVWQPALLEADGSGFSYDGENLVMGVCGAGVFPPATAILLSEGSPELAQTSLPVGTALQFVYDAANDEVVVFSG